LADRSPVARRYRSGYLSGAHTFDHFRHHARDRPFQSRAGRCRDHDGVGASVSGLAAGLAVDHFGYSVSFLAFSAAAAVAFLVFFGFMPETRDAHATAHEAKPLALEGAAVGE
jgi:hypothetical protein